MTPYADLGDVQLFHGDAIATLAELEPKSVHSVITSPPYFGLRKYAGVEPSVWDDGWLGTLGAEPSVTLFIRHLVAVFRAVKRVLRDDGVLFLDIGDSYSGSGKGPTGHNGIGDQKERQGFADQRSRTDEIPAKNLLLVPQRLAIALQGDGWVIRSVFPWLKRNCLPGSQRDRPTTAHEDWIMATKKPNYWFDLEAIRRKESASSNERYRYSFDHLPRSWENETTPISGGKKPPGMRDDLIGAGRAYRTTDPYFDSLDETIQEVRGDLAHLERCRDQGGILCGDETPLALDICPEPSKLAHYASFGEGVIRDLVLASTPERCCATCGAGWERQMELARMGDHGVSEPKRRGRREQSLISAKSTLEGRHDQYVTLGWSPSCRCQADTRPGVTLDPFVGTGTVAVVARKLGRRAIGIDASGAYLSMAEKRIQGVTPTFAVTAVESDDPKQLDFLEASV